MRALLELLLLLTHTHSQAVACTPCWCSLAAAHREVFRHALLAAANLQQAAVQIHTPLVVQACVGAELLRRVLRRAPVDDASGVMQVRSCAAAVCPACAGCCAPFSLNAWLNEMRWPSFSVSTSTCETTRATAGDARALACCQCACASAQRELRCKQCFECCMRLTPSQSNSSACRRCQRSDTDDSSRSSMGAQGMRIDCAADSWTLAVT